MVANDLLKRVDELVELGKSALSKKYQEAGTPYWLIPTHELTLFTAAVRSFLQRHFGSSHTYSIDFDNSLKGMSSIYSIERGLAVLTAMRDEMIGGWLTSMKSLVSAEIFSDFLEMADHLLLQDFKDAAAVMIGGVLEEHLRQLSGKHGIDITYLVSAKTTPKMAGMLNDELAKIGAYNKLDHKSVLAWLDLRNKAAHGKYSEYAKNQVELMSQGVANFMARNPA